MTEPRRTTVAIEKAIERAALGRIGFPPV